MFRQIPGLSKAGSQFCACNESPTPSGILQGTVSAFDEGTITNRGFVPAVSGPPVRGDTVGTLRLLIKFDLLKGSGSH